MHGHLYQFNVLDQVIQSRTNLLRCSSESPHRGISETCVLTAITSACCLHADITLPLFCSRGAFLRAPLPPDALAPGSQELLALQAIEIDQQAGAELDRTRSEERRVGKECVSTCSSRCPRY